MPYLASRTIYRMISYFKPIQSKKNNDTVYRKILTKRRTSRRHQNRQLLTQVVQAPKRPNAAHLVVHLTEFPPASDKCLTVASKPKTFWRLKRRLRVCLAVTRWPSSIKKHHQYSKLWVLMRISLPVFHKITRLAYPKILLDCQK